MTALLMAVTVVAVAALPAAGQDEPAAAPPTSDAPVEIAPEADATTEAAPAGSDAPPASDATAAGPGPVADPGDVPVTDAASTIAEAPDYATEVLGDPWDFANAEDRLWLQRSKVWAPIIGDSIQYTGDASNILYLVNGWGGDLPHGRDGRVVPVDTSRYTHVSFRITASGITNPTNAGAVFWSQCVPITVSCKGGRSVAIGNGTSVITVPVHLGSTFGAGAPAAWTGQMPMVWLQITGNATMTPTIAIDWIRIHGDTGNPASDPYPPGVHAIGPDTVTVDARPRPVVVDPDLAGGDDYATTVRAGDAWDMSQASDLAAWRNVTVGFGGGRAHAASSGTYNDPIVWFGAPSTINTRRWHRLSMHVSYDGPFGLENAPGGGMVGRFVWTNDAAAPYATQESNDILVYPGDQEIVVDLHTTPFSALNDEGTVNPKGWGGAGSTLVREPRWDAHEDPGYRTWRIDEVRLARNDIADPLFTIRFTEDPTTYQPGTTADVFLVATPSLTGGTKLNAAPLAVAAGENALVLDATTLDVQGTYWVRVDMTDPGGATSSALSTGPVETSTPFEFIDVLPGNGFYWDIRWLVKAKIANGYSPDAFGPTLPISRQAMAAFLYRQAGSPNGVSPVCATDPFTDVGVGGPFCGEIAWLADQGIAGGYPDGSYGSTNPISRQAMAAFLYRAGNPGAGEPAPCVERPFPDVTVDSAFCGHITWMKGTGITGGYADGTFRPGAPVSRQAMASFLRTFDGL